MIPCNLFAVVLLLAAGGCAAPITEPMPPANVFTLGSVEQPGSGTTKALTIATYNVHWLIERDKIRADLARRGDADMWLFQEMRLTLEALDGDGISARSLLENLMPPGLWQVAVVRVNRLREENSVDWEAQIIASRLRLESVQVWELDAVRPKRRVALAARVRLGEDTLIVVNTDHAPSFLPLRSANDFEVDQLCQRLVQSPQGRMLVAGDFNCSGRLFGLVGNDTHVRRLDRTLANAGMAPVDLAAPTFEAWPLSLRLDRIYSRGVRVIAAGVDDAATGSDHRPVWCRLELSS